MSKFILVISDHFTKWVEIFAIPNETSEVCAQVLVNEVIGRFGCPNDLHSDQGRNFESKVFKSMCAMLGIRKTRTSPKNPKCNGQTERFNSTLATMIRAYIKDQTDWDLHLGCLAGAYRSTPHEITTLTPNMMMIGREVRCPIEIGMPVGNDSCGNEGQYVTELRDKFYLAHQVARSHLGKAAIRQKAKYDVKASPVNFGEGGGD